MADEVERFGASIEKGLLGRFDAHLEAKGYPSRSAALTDLIRDALSEAATVENPDHPAIGSLTLFYDHTRKDLADKLSELGHDHHELILTTLHFHLDQERCMEVIALKGTVADLQHFADHVHALKGVQQVKLALAADEGSTRPHRHRGKHGHGHTHRHARSHAHR
jgi:CopG family nickel-responsive transcriptional regulator